MKRFTIALCGLVIVLAALGCSKQATTSAPASSAATAAPLPVRHDVDINFNDIAPTETGLLRLGFTAHNISKDPIQCDASEFSITLSDGTVVQADESAENKCSLDMIDPGATGKVTVFFNMKAGYTGAVTLSMAANDAVVGKASTQVK